VLASTVLGDDPIAIQRELKLPTRKIWNLALGKAAQAFRTARADDRFAQVERHIPEDWVERLALFADERNSWAHGAVQGSHTQIIDRAFATMREGIEITAWISLELSSLGEAAKPRRTAPRRLPNLRIRGRERDGDFSVFVSHSSTDAAIASRLAMGLEAVGYRSWYDKWDLKAGDSIVDRIQTALSACDVLLVVLSPRSVASEWVHRELNAGLMRELGGHSVVVIPVLIEDCDIPPLLEERHYIDLRNNFEDGFLELLDSLRQHREEIRR
jgi:TIR domain